MLLALRVRISRRDCPERESIAGCCAALLLLPAGGRGCSAALARTHTHTYKKNMVAVAVVGVAALAHTHAQKFGGGLLHCTVVVVAAEFWRRAYTHTRRKIDGGLLH